MGYRDVFWRFFGNGEGYFFRRDDWGILFSFCSCENVAATTVGDVASEDGGDESSGGDGLVRFAQGVGFA